MNPKLLIKKSKHLSLILRHDPGSAGITLTEGGWAPVASILEALHVSKEGLDQVVLENDKQRFEYTDDGLFIRARQGHTVEVNLGYEPQEPPELLYHGTSWGCVPVISQQGLKKMLRHHVHLSATTSAALVVARRWPEPVVLTVEAYQMFEGGHQFYLTPNGVWLTEHVPSAFIHEPG